MKKQMRPGRIIALGFLSIILIGAVLLALPISWKADASVSFLDALFTSTSAVCVTGLSTFDAGSTLSTFGQIVLALLIQLGGLGFVSLSIGVVMMTGHKVFLNQQNLVKEALNYGSMDGISTLVKSVLVTTLIIEGAGALLLFPIFLSEYPLVKALGMSFFHSISSFNNAGFDIFGKGDNLISCKDNVPLIIITALLIIFGGIGYLVIKEVTFKRRFRAFSLHTKIVLTVTAALLIIGTVLFKLTEGYGWLDAFFMSTSSRTAGFTTVPLSKVSNTGAMVYCILMFIGASPTSTGGGIKTTTFFLVILALYSYVSENKVSVYKRSISKALLHKAFVIFSIGLGVFVSCLTLLCITEPDVPIKDLMMESASAFATVGLSTGITPTLSALGKMVVIITMYIGRIGPLTVASLWIAKKSSGVSYAEESVTLG